jgi:PAS domain S-box-containing protein
MLLVLQSALIAALLFQRSKRRRAQRALGMRLRFETLLSDLSAQFASLSAAEVDRGIGSALQRIAAGLAVDLVSVGSVSESSDRMLTTHSWGHDRIAGLPAVFAHGRVPWLASRLREGRPVSFSRPDDVPAEAAADRASLLECGVNSLTAVPFGSGARLGFLSVASVRAIPHWPDDLTPRLALLAEVFANAVARLRAEQAMRESEARFRRMADTAPVMIWLSNRDAGSHRTYVNQRWLDFTGRPADSEHDDLWLADVHETDRPEVIAAIQAAADERRAFTVEYRLRRRDGQYRIILDHGVPRIAESEAFDGHIGSAIDITELRRAQQSLVETDALRSAIFGSLYGRVAALDRDGVIIAVNEAWARASQALSGTLSALGVGSDYLSGCRRAAANGDVEGARTLEAIARVLDGRSDHVQIEYLRPAPSGDRWFEMAVEPLRRPEGGVVIVHVDVTRRREAEEEMRRQRDQLAHVLRVTTLGELAASLAHEINQPLTAIITDAQAGERLLGASHPEVKEALGDIVADARRASDIIRGLRALFRKERERPTLVDVNDLVRSVAGLLRADLVRKRIGVSFALAPDLPMVFGDSVQLQQVVLNVLVNAADAIEATEGGRREVALVTEAPAADRVEIRVEDTGIGVKSMELDRIFDHFVTSKPQGLGMGLSISRSIVRAHGGRIWASPACGRGLHVHIELPCGPLSAA